MSYTNAADGHDMQEVIDKFVDAFNRNDLDAAIHYFAADAVYLPGDGSESCGAAAIRKTLEPQFSGALGVMHFDEYDRLVDERERKVAIRWTCRMDFTQARFYSLSLWFLRWVATLVAGSRRVCWEGLDVFHFNAQGKIIGKYTYANYPLPRLKRDLRANQSA